MRIQNNNNNSDEDTENKILENIEINYSERDEDIFHKFLNYQFISTKYELNNSCPKVLIDASLILDVLLARPSIFLDDAINIINLVLSRSINGYIAEIGLKYTWDISRKLKGKEDANYLVIKLLNSFNVCKINSELIKRAREYHLNSFETGIQIECAKDNKIDAIITLRAKDFLGCGWENVFHPSRFLDYYNSAGGKKIFEKDDYSNIEIFKEKLNQSLKIPQEKEYKLLCEEQLFLFKAWKVEHFELLCSKNSLASATVILLNTKSNNKDCRHSESAFGRGAIETLFSALDRAISHIVEQPKHILESIKVSNLEQGIECSASVVVVVKYKNVKVRKFYVHRNIVNACFYAYVEALKAIYNPDGNSSDNYLEEELLSTTKMSICQEEILKIYQIGERDFSESNWKEINLESQNLSEINLSNSDLSLSNLQRINLSNAYLSEVNLKNAILVEANLISAVLTKGILSEADISKAILCRANLNKANFIKAKLIQADLTKTDLTESDLTNANLSGADLTESNLANANLSGTDLTGANLTNANLSGADLTGANLTNANLSGTDLTGVDLTTTTIDGANLSKSNLSRADLRGLDLNKTVFCQQIVTDTAMPEFKIEIYGNKRIEQIIQLFNQFDSDHYVIYAVHTFTFGCWWNSDIAKEFRQINKELSRKGISIKRVFILPKGKITNEIHEIIEEQVNHGIEIRLISEDFAENFNGYDFRKTNLLVCKNTLVPENSFTSMMLVNKEQQEESGYISYKKDDIEMNEQRFTMIWENAEPYLLPELRYARKSTTYISRCAFTDKLTEM